ncbi:M15 family metallopeptidase [Sporosarcina luteola]|uniref:M15 family metallopeptidase n=1 Tax=Sporosarcina luteola TaxID=582850 RepID=UPI00203FF513|nr:D-alanyl-D-alanine carboxypeptidase family protein [Sporosarcina luteola]MCM3710287.1 D-alanyl-D-alanine carboxypeptidase family protein [Sporosarcina luteola]
MNRNRKYQSRKKSNKALTITLLLTSLLMTAIVVWIGMNNWDVNRALRQVGIGDTQTPPVEERVEDADEPEETEPETEPEVQEEDPVEETPVEEEPPAEVKEPETKEPETKEPEKNITPAKPAPNNEEKPKVTAKPPTSPNKSGYIEGQQLPDKPTVINGIVVANKKYPLPSTYAPGESKEARAAFNEMAAEATLSGINLTAFSTYRSYEYQVTLYERYVKKDGVEKADTYSARPGYSEHQTGLAFDIGEVNYEKYWASSKFGDTEAGKWVAANAYRYGFILRYPKGKETVTGYMHESWHFRYVGKEIAEEIFKRNITLEEYLGLK